MPDTFYLKRNDTLPKLVVNLLDGGAAYDVTGQTPRLIMKIVGGGIPKVDRQLMTIEDGFNGVVSYSFSSVETDTEGTYEVEVEVEDVAGDILTFPTVGYYTVVVGVDLG